MWYIHIFALFELYLVQLDYKIKLSCCTPHRSSTTISLKTKPIYSYVVDYNAFRCCEAKNNQNLLNRLRLGQKSPKNSAYSYTNTLTLLKYFSSASHDIILSLSYDLISYTLFLLLFLFFLLFYVLPVYRVHVPFKAVFFLIYVLCLKEI